MSLFSLSDSSQFLEESQLWDCVNSNLAQEDILDPCMPKPKGEVLIKGKCFTPNAKPLPACKVRIKIGNINKELFVFGNRYWIKKAGIIPIISEPEPFTEMDISWENAFGGLGYEKNPIGKGYSPIKTKSGKEIHPLPNIEDPNNLITSPSDHPEPASFGPLELTWPQRARKLGTYDEKWLKERWPWFPNDFDWSYFNAAPLDQQIDNFFKGDEEIYIENMHPEKPQIRAKLPGIRTRCFITQEIKGKKIFKEIKLNLDTIWLFPNEEKGILIWHGVTPIASEEADDIEHILIVSEKLEEEPKSLEYYQGILFEEIKKEEMEEVEEEVEEEIFLPKRPFFTPEEEALFREAEEKIAVLEARFREKIKKMGLDPDEVLKKATEYGPPSDDPNEIIKWAEEQTAIQEQKFHQRLKELGYDPDEVLKQKKKEPVSFSIKQQIAKLKENLQKFGIKDPEIEKKVAEAERNAEEIEKEFKELIEMFTPIDKKTFLTGIKTGQSFSGKDLTGLDLSNFELKGVDLSEANLEGVNFSGANLEGANLSGAILTNANFSKAKLMKANLKRCDASETNFSKANLTGADLTEADFSEADMSEVNLLNASLNDTIFENTKLQKANFVEAIAKGADFTGADLSEANFFKADLTEADFSEAKLDNVNFSQVIATSATFDGAKGKNVVFKGADLKESRADEETFFQGANFEGSSFIDACWEGANLSYANFEKANLDGADFTKCDLKGANFYRASAKGTKFSKANLTEAKMVSVNLFQGAMDKAKLINTDLRGSNLYEVEFLEAEIEKAIFRYANLKMTKLFGKF